MHAKRVIHTVLTVSTYNTHIHVHTCIHTHVCIHMYIRTHNVTHLFVHDPLSSSGYPIIYTHPVAGSSPIKTLVARRWQTNKHTHTHTHSTANLGTLQQPDNLENHPCVAVWTVPVLLSMPYWINYTCDFSPSCFSIAKVLESAVVTIGCMRCMVECTPINVM